MIGPVPRAAAALEGWEDLALCAKCHTLRQQQQLLCPSCSLYHSKCYTSKSLDRVSLISNTCIKIEHAVSSEESLFSNFT